MGKLITFFNTFSWFRPNLTVVSLPIYQFVNVNG
jgi:hypothetical protein